MVKMIAVASVAAGGLLVQVAVAGGVPGTAPAPVIPQSTSTPIAKYLAAQGVKIAEEFGGPSGLRGVVADNGRERRVFYVTADGKTLIAGQLFDATGANLAAADARRVGIPGPGQTHVKALGEAELKALWQRVEALRAVSEGSSGQVVYVFFDPNCPYCHRLWDALSSAVKSGNLQVRWLPVAILKDDSKGLGAAIYAAPSPGVALAKMADRSLVAVAVSERVNRDIAMNLLALRDTGFTGVPLLMFRNGDRIEMISGVPDQAQIDAWRGGKGKR